MIHVDHQRRIDGGARQARIAGAALDKADIVQPGAAHPALQVGEIARGDVLRDDAPGLADHRRQADGVIATARADIRNGLAAADADEPDDIGGFTGGIAADLIGPDRADDAGDFALRRLEGERRRGEQQQGKRGQTHGIQTRNGDFGHRARRLRPICGNIQLRRGNAALAAPVMARPCSRANWLRKRCRSPPPSCDPPMNFNAIGLTGLPRSHTS